MRRLMIIGAVAGTFALTALVDAVVRANSSGLLASNWAPWPAWFGMTVTIGLAAGLAYLVLHRSPPDLGDAILVAGLGAIVGYSWPVAFTLGIVVPDLFTQWAISPALMIWQGLLVLAIGIAAVIRWYMAGPPRDERREG